MSSQAFDSYVDPAREGKGGFKLMAGLIVIVLGWLLWTVIVLGIWVSWGAYQGTPLPQAVERLGQDFMSGHPSSVALALLTFFGIWPSTALVVRWFHRQRPMTLISPERRFRWNEFAMGAGLALILWIAATLIGIVVVGAPARSTLPLETWAMWLIPIAILVVIQAGGEELIFRGYLLQQLAAINRNPLIWGVAPALIFGMAHYDPTRGTAINGVYVGATLIFGLIAAVLVWRTGGLAAAIGIHAANNFGALGITGLESVASGSQLFVYSASLKEPLIIIDLVLMTAMLVWLLSPACPRWLRAPSDQTVGVVSR